MTGFHTLGLAPGLRDTLARLGFAAPTPIQARAIPPALAGRDLIGLAQTGTGKTLAYGLPLVQGLAGARRPAPKAVAALILAPTRELARQIAAALAELARGTPLRVETAVGGAGLHGQAQRLARGADLLVATPGRLTDLLARRALSLADTRRLVLDEADRMLDMGFLPALRRILRQLPEARQTLLFSATLPAPIETLAAAVLTRPVRIEIAAPGRPAARIDQGVHFVARADKARLLESYLGRHPGEAALVFCRTRHGAERLARLLAAWGFAAASIHGDKTQGQRDRALAAFRAGRVGVLVATDVAARGLDIPQVRHVYNHDLPEVPETYVHRIGRTARAGAEGRAVAFCAPAELAALRAIETTMNQPVPVLGGAPPAAAAPDGPSARGGGVRPGSAPRRRTSAGRRGRRSAGSAGG